jgi:hypothetical protein
MNSNNTSAAEQGRLLLTRAVARTDVPIDTISKRKTLLAAINLCIDLSGLEDKELYLPLGVDAGHWSNLRKGKGHFPTDAIDPLMDLCSNEVPLIWLALKRGYGLVVLKTEAERRADVAEERARAAEAENRLMRQLLAGKAAA